MSQFLSRGHLRCVLLCFVMATLSIYFSNIHGYHQGFAELSASTLLLCPDFIALVETHLVSGESLQMYLPPGYVVAARHDRSCHGGCVLLLCRDVLLVASINCEMYYQRKDNFVCLPPA